MRQNSNRFWLVATFIWGILIFATSCSFIERQVFIDFVKRFIPEGMPQHLWVGFWSGFGIFVVKAYHVAEFALLCTLLYVVCRRRFLKNQAQAIMIAAATATLYAISDEWHQTFVPGRGGTWVDVIIDFCGISLAAAFILWREKRTVETVAVQS